MPRYFVTTNYDSAPDVIGFEFEDIADARCEAVKLAGTMICEAAGTFWEGDDFHMTVKNTGGLTLFALMFVGTEAATIKPIRARPAII
jgi:hypothetical protein